jgi:hypothetical protein
MNRFRREVSAGVRSLLLREREIAALPADARRRMMARARAAVDAKVYSTAAAEDASRLRRWAVAAVLLSLASAAAGAAGYQIRSHTSLSLAPSSAKAASTATK